MTVTWPSSGELEQQEKELQFDGFGNDVAVALGQHLLALAHRDGLPLALTVRRGGQVLFQVGLAGSSLDNDAWLDRKCRVVERYGQSSLRVGMTFRDQGTTFEDSARLDPATHAAHGGAFPILVTSVGPVGVVAVSGLPQVQAHEFVVEGLRDFLTS